MAMSVENYASYLEGLKTYLEEVGYGLRVQADTFRNMTTVSGGEMVGLEQDNEQFQRITAIALEKVVYRLEVWYAHKTNKS